MEIQQVSSSGAQGFQPAVKASAPDVKPQSAESAVPVAVVSTQAVQQAAATPSVEEVKQSVEKINKTIQSMNSNLQFSVDEDTKKNIVKVVDMQTKDVIRQIPSPEVLAIAKALDKLQGLLVRDKA